MVSTIRCWHAVCLFLIGSLALFVENTAAQEANFKTIYSFYPSAGTYPSSSLIQDSSGNLYGTTGPSPDCELDCGTVFELSPTADGWTETVLHTFHCGGRSGVDCPSGSMPMASLTLDSQGNLYGTTIYGGANGDGVVFELSPAPDGAWTESLLYSFCALENCADGMKPISGVLYDAQGNLYGTTVNGGASGDGVVYELTPTGGGQWGESVLYSFSGGADGGDPEGNLVADSAGDLYGTTFLGGSDDNAGVAYELAKSSGVWNETVIHTFGSSRQDGISPMAGMVFGPNGSLYGTTAYGGKVTEGHGIGFGVVFELTAGADGWTENILWEFNGGDQGGQPLTGLVLDASGNIYGTTSAGGEMRNGAGGGVAFELQQQSGGSWNEILLHKFRGADDGATPNTLLLGSGGILYGTAASGGAEGYGVAFEINPN